MIQFIANQGKYGVFGQFFQNSKEVGSKIKFNNRDDAERYAAEYFSYELSKGYSLEAPSLRKIIWEDVAYPIRKDTFSCYHMIKLPPKLARFLHAQSSGIKR